MVTGIRQLWAEKVLCVSVSVCHENCLLWTIPSIPSISFFLELLFPSFVQNPSGFVLFSVLRPILENGTIRTAITKLF